jgi:hypothetical protein
MNYYIFKFKKKPTHLFFYKQIFIRKTTLIEKKIKNYIEFHYFNKRNLLH